MGEECKQPKSYWGYEQEGELRGTGREEHTNLLYWAEITG